MTRGASTLPAWHRRLPRVPGLQPLIDVGADGARELQLYRLRPERGVEMTLAFPGRESATVLLDGAVQFRSVARTHRAARHSPFAGPASALYLPSGFTATVTATEPDSELLVATAAAEAGGEPHFVGPEDVQVLDRGAGSYRREVHNILVNDPFATRLLVGETFNPPGGWSSYPPHKHDAEDGEPYLEEVYYYRTDPSKGFGFQALYTKDGTLDQAVRVQDGDAALIQRGYHPVAAAPGYHLHYFWALAGQQRELVVFEDETHAWVAK